MPSSSTIIAMGDIHGELDALQEMLCHAGILGDQGQWVGGSTVVVQTGDVIDRGPDSVGAYKMLEELQIEALRTDGAVVRLLGNHELVFLRKEYYLTNIVDRRNFRRMLRQDVLAGKVQAAYAGQGFLFTHAGVRSEIQQCLLQGQQVGRAEDTAQGLARKLNGILIDALKAEDFSHPIFRIGESCGGAYPVGGIFWTRGVFSSLKASSGARPSERRVDIDVGIHCYRGRAYLTLLAVVPAHSTLEKTLPNGVESERAVLGAILLDEKQSRCD